MANVKDTAATGLVMVVNTQETGKMGATMDLARVPGRTVDAIAESGATAWRTGREKKPMQMELFGMRASGSTTNQCVDVFGNAEFALSKLHAILHINAYAFCWL